VNLNTENTVPIEDITDSIIINCRVTGGKNDESVWKDSDDKLNGMKMQCSDMELEVSVSTLMLQMKASLRMIIHGVYLQY